MKTLGRILLVLMLCVPILIGQQQRRLSVGEQLVLTRNMAIQWEGKANNLALLLRDVLLIIEVTNENRDFFVEVQRQMVANGYSHLTVAIPPPIPKQGPLVPADSIDVED